MVDLADLNKPVDAITMTETLRTRGKLEAIGGPAYIADLARCVPTASNVAFGTAHHRHRRQSHSRGGLRQSARHRGFLR
jgi:hypothetical protein